MVNQFALQAESTGFGALGWVAIGDSLGFALLSPDGANDIINIFCVGLLWRLASATFATGPVGAFLASFGFLFSTQSLALTIIRFSF